MILRARWFDPDSGKRCEFTFEAEKITTAEGRRAWMIRKSLALAQRRRELSGGAARHTGLSLPEAVEIYFSTAASRLKDKTVANYRAAGCRFLDWCRTSRIAKGDDLHPHHLAVFAQWLAAQPAKAAVKGGTRTERAATTRTCSPGGVNNRLRAIKAILNHLRRVGQLAHLSSDDIKDRLKPLKAPRPRPAFLRPAQVQGLMRAALLHDAAVFDMTRAEKTDGSRAATPKHEPIAAFVAYTLLSGCRLEEALSVPWTAIDMDAKDERGVRVGEIVLRASDVKTGHERAIDLGICPGLLAILQALKLRSTGEPYVFGGKQPWSRTKMESARRRLVEKYGAPAFCWSQTEGTTPALRATCGTFLTNAPGIYGGAASFHSAKRLGHSVLIAERHYVGLLRGIPPGAKTLEAAMEIEPEVAEIAERLTRTASPIAVAHVA